MEKGQATSVAMLKRAADLADVYDAMHVASKSHDRLHAYGSPSCIHSSAAVSAASAGRDWAHSLSVSQQTSLKECSRRDLTYPKETCEEAISDLMQSNKRKHTEEI